MTLEDRVHAFRLQLFRRAKELGNVSKEVPWQIPQPVNIGAPGASIRGSYDHGNPRAGWDPREDAGGSRGERSGTLASSARSVQAGCSV
jgi:hypothetical protein